MRDDHPLARFAAATRANAKAVARVRRRIDATHGDADTASLLAALPRHAPGATARVRARLARRERRNRLPAWGLGALALAALVFLGVRVLTPPPPPPLSATLAAPTAWQALAPTDEVRLDFQGQGVLAGTARAPRLDWEQGTLKVEVEPERGIDLAVHTREAEVRVVGTGFSVTRDALGTGVVVTHGHVAVLCADGEKALLGAGEARVCPPTHAAGLLGRANALAAQGDTAAALEAARAGLATDASGAVRSELELTTVDALTRLGRADEALAAAEASLAGSPARPSELRHLAVRNAITTTGCPAALPHLRVLVGEDATAPELVYFADCVADTEPAAARAALTAALRQGAPPDQEARIIQRLTHLAPELGP